MLFLGVAPAGPDDPRVVDLAGGLARAGMATLVYWSPEMQAKRIHAADVQNLTAAFSYLQSQPFVDPQRVGFAGFCIGASFVLMAAAQEEIRAEVAFVNAFGPYYDLLDLARALGTSTRFYDGERQPWVPDALTREVAELLLLEHLEPLEAAAVRAALDGGTPDAPEGLSPQAAAIHRVLAGGSVELVEEAVTSLPQALVDQMAMVSPRSYVADISAPVLIMHDRADSLVPSDESRRLADTLADRGDVHYTEFSLFQHMDPTRSLNWWDQVRELNKLFWHLYTILRQAA